MTVATLIEALRHLPERLEVMVGIRVTDDHGTSVYETAALKVLVEEETVILWGEEDL
jgi:hypothetical protein